MANEVTIKISARDASGPAFTSVVARARAVGAAVNSALSSAARDVERSQRDMASAADRAQRQMAREAERAGREIERAQRQAAREAERAARDVERAHRNAAREAERAHRKAEEQVRQSHRKMADSGLSFGDVLGKLFTGRLRSATDGANNMIEGFFRNSAMKAAETSQSIVSSFVTAAASGGAMTAATGGLNLLVGALIAAAAAAAALAVGFVALAPVVSLVGGTAGAAATALVGLVGAVGVLGMGLGGLGDAWSAYGQKAAGGGGSAAAAAKKAALAQREVENATYDLEQAQRSYLQAQQAVNRAIEDEIERRDDLKRSIAGALEDQVGAALAVQRAQERLNEALAQRSQGKASDLDVAEAEHSLRQAGLAVEDLKDRVGDLKKEQADGARVGVKGSEAVTTAMERQEQAARALQQAELRLKDAKAALKEGAVGAAGGVNAFAEAMAKLSPNARALVRTLIDLKPKFDDLKKSVQDRLLEGYAGQVRDLAGKWLPALHDMLGDLAGVFNRIGANMMEAFGRRQFIDDIGEAMDGFGEGVGIAFSHVDKLIEAIGRLARGSVPFFKAIGGLVDDLIVKFSNWINAADKSGKLESFMEQAAATLRDVWDIGVLTVQVVGDLIEALFPSSKKASDSLLSGVKSALEDLHKWLSDPKNQQAIRENVDAIIDAFKEIGPIVTTVKGWFKDLDATVKVLDFFTTTPAELADAWDWLARKARTAWRSIRNTFTGAASGIARYVSSRFDAIVSTVRGLPGRISRAASGMWDGFKGAFKSALNWVIDKWNGLQFRMPTILGGGTIDTPNITRFAHGGIAGGLAMVGERGRELVQLPHGSRVIPNGTTEAMLAGAGGGPVDVRLSVDPAANSKLINALVEAFRYEIRSKGGGNVQRYLGQPGVS